MAKEAFSHVRHWVFDLDHTLYPPSARLFELIEVRMTAYVMQTLNVGQAEADRLRKYYWARHGTTLAGLMRELKEAWDAIAAGRSPAEDAVFSHAP